MKIRAVHYIEKGKYTKTFCGKVLSSRRFYIYLYDWSKVTCQACLRKKFNDYKPFFLDNGEKQFFKECGVCKKIILAINDTCSDCNTSFIGQIKNIEETNHGN